MDTYIVSARKYRPDSFSDVIGQHSITTTLKNSIHNNHLGHAYLFSGPRGVGKTTCARIFAKTINCSRITDSGEACNSCESCRSFNENRSYSIHELDAASNNSVDDIRTLTEQVRIPPQIGSYSIYIIDEVHMLSQSAFNAFLKTLEEPPRHAIFILATTEKHKILPTILSRCQIFDFNRIKIEDIVEYLKQIAGQEKISYEEDALHVIAQKADGAMRDALSIFDQVVSFSGGDITYRDVITNLNILDYEYYFRLTAALLDRDISNALLIFDDILARGFDARNFINGFAAHLRDLMVCKDAETVQLMEVGAGIREKYLAGSAGIPLSFIYEALEICNQADLQFRTSRNQRLTIELALVRLANLQSDAKKKVVPSGGQETQADNLPSGKPEAPGEPLSSGKPQAADISNGAGRIIRKPSISIKESLRGRLPGQDTADVTDPAGQNEVPSVEACAVPVEPDQILKAWDDYAATIEKSRPRIFSTLKSGRPVVKADGSVMVRLNTEAQRDNFVKNIKPRLVKFIQDTTGLSALEIFAEVPDNEQNGKKIYTDQDKLDFLMQKNPELGQFKSRFNLDFDH
ncbi:MAG TPA: DNA polymerase III subunit gamma/tau [Bacteroides sp.]|nr:DNA polymerase III subunit gamma/tau [Bacteroides sp.]